MPPPGVDGQLGLLRWLAYQTGGSASAPLSRPDELGRLVSGASRAVTLTRLETDLSADLDVWEDHDGFETAPDFRLTTVAVGAGGDGCVRFSGSVDLAKRDPPKEVRLRLSRGGATATLTLPMPSALPADPLDAPPASPLLPGGLLQLPATSEAGATARRGAAEAAWRLLEVQHTLLQLSQIGLVLPDPDAAKQLCTESGCAAFEPRGHPLWSGGACDRV